MYREKHSKFQGFSLISLLKSQTVRMYLTIYGLKTHDIFREVCQKSIKMLKLSPVEIL